MLKLFMFRTLRELILFFKGLKPANKEELKKIIKNRIQTEGPECDLNDIDVSDITDMSRLFEGSLFNGDISKWDVSNVTDMSWMFSKCQFTGDISKWDVSNVTDMYAMFSECQFTGDISRWNVSSYPLFYKPFPLRFPWLNQSR